MEQVPVLEIITTSDGVEHSEFLTQSLAIIQYIDEVFPGGAPLLPTDPKQRFHARQV
jgi:glutathione S-transferase